MNVKEIANALLCHIVGFRSKKRIHMIIASVYYLLSFLLSVALGRLFIFTLVMLWSVPFCIFAIIDAFRLKKYKLLWTLPICVVLLVVSTLCVPNNITSISIDADNISFVALNDTKEINFIIDPSNADTSKVQLVSEDPSIASFSGNILTSVSVGETSIYATAYGIESLHIPVSVRDLEAEAQQKATEIENKINSIGEVSLESKQAIDDAEALYNSADETVKSKVTNAAVLSSAKEQYNTLKAEQERVEQERAEQEAKAEQERQAQEAKAEQERIAAEKKASSAAQANSSNGKTVYVGKTGNKYHKQSCRTLKGGGIAISLSEAKAQGRTACKICGG